MSESDTSDWEIIKTITEAEHHFNNLCFKIRTLASTWLLATFAGVGFLLERTTSVAMPIDQYLVILCWAGSTGIILLWIIDLLIYQQLLNAWFDSRKAIEERNTQFPQIRAAIKSSQPGGRATNLLKSFYLGLSAAPLLFSLFVGMQQKVSNILMFVSLVLLLCFMLLIWYMTPAGEIAKNVS